MRKNDWIATYSGIKFYPLDPYPEDIKIEDIAHALSLICRYNGQCKYFYSVGQHSLNVYNYLAMLYPTDYTLQLVGLLHDASEAYISDICRPTKSCLTNYKAIESCVQSAVLVAFGLNFTSVETGLVKAVDDLVLYAEAKVLMKNIDSWVKHVDLKIDTFLWAPELVEETFLSIFHKLNGLRG